MMRKKNFALSIMAAALLASCSTTQNGISVGDVSNTECDRNMTRAAIVTSPKVRLTRNGANIDGALTDYQVGCSHGDLSVDCRQEGSLLDIRVREAESDAPRANCLCQVNIYFTLYDVEGDDFMLCLDGDSLGNISFREHHVVEVDRVTLDQAHEDGFDYQTTLYAFGFSEFERPDANGQNAPSLRLWFNGDRKEIGGVFNNYFLPCDAVRFEMKMDVDADGTLVLTPLVDGVATDGKPTEGCYRRTQGHFSIVNALQDRYRIRFNPHKVTVKDDDGTEREETAVDFEGELAAGGEIVEEWSE